MADATLPAILLFGPPGVGKGTQGRILANIPGFFHLSSGDVFRALDINTSAGKEALQFISKGELVPDELTMRIWRNSLDGQIALSAYKPYEDLLILDGIPRTTRQAELLSDHVDILGVVQLFCADEERMIHRIKRRAIRENRTDDASEEIIRHRFEVYHKESAPVIDTFPKDIIAQVDGTMSPAEVLREILNFVIPVQNQHFRSSREQE